MADKQVLMQLVNMLTGTLQGIGQQRQQGSQFRAGMEQDRARQAMQAKQFEAQHKLRMEDSVRNQKIFDMQMEQADVFQQDRDNKMKLGEALGEIAGASGDLNWTSFESIMEDPGVQEAGLVPLLQQFPDVAEPYMTEKRELPWESMLSLNFAYEDLPADWQAVMPPDAWDKAKADFRAMTDAGLLGTELGNTMLKAQIRDFDQRYAGEGIYAEGYGRTGGGGPGAGDGLGETPDEPMSDDAVRTQLSQYTVAPEEGWTDAGILARITEIEGLVAGFEGEGKGELALYATNMKRQLQDILQGVLAPSPKASTSSGETSRKPEYGLGPSGRV